MLGPKCCLGGGCAPEDARRAGAASPSPLGALGLAPEAARLRVPGGPVAGQALPLLLSATPGAQGRERLPGVVGTARRSARQPQPQPQQVRGLDRSRPPKKETGIVSGTRDTCRGHEPSGATSLRPGTADRRAVPASAVAATIIQPRPERAAWARPAGKGVLGARGEPKPGGAGPQPHGLGEEGSDEPGGMADLLRSVLAYASASPLAGCGKEEGGVMKS